jgi:hypothetical protein
MNTDPKPWTNMSVIFAACLRSRGLIKERFKCGQFEHRTEMENGMTPLNVANQDFSSIFLFLFLVIKTLDPDQLEMQHWL